MPVLLAALAVLLLLLVLAGCGKKDKPEPPPVTPAPPPAQNAEPTQTGSVKSRADVEKRLQKRATAPAPTELKVGACCYKPAAAEPKVDYACPKCGEKTVYAVDNSAPEAQRTAQWSSVRTVNQDLPGCRRMIAKIRERLDAELDESQFCRKCSPGVETPKLVLIVKYPAEPQPHKTVGVTLDDLQLVCEFLQGKDKHTYPNEGERPLKDFLPRLEQLLGTKP
ncbi:MAG TPA: hypothetical protein VGP72_11845 [Planctomycetota bacterium]|jgi:predicted RNA-binding Zn-ribbon protein involved in translation (DUF1610 family)/predicted small lipoprotein YifL